MSLFSKLKQIQDLKKKAGELKGLMAAEIVEIDEGGVKMKMNGQQEILELTINEQLLNSENKNQLEKTLQKNFNEAIKKIQRLMAEKIQASGFKMPNLN